MSNFEGHIEGDLPVVADFVAGWSTPCKLMDPVMHEVKEVVGDRATVIRIDIEKEARYAELYNVWSVPTLIIFKRGHELWRKTGITAANEILEHLKLHIR